MTVDGFGAAMQEKCAPSQGFGCVWTRRLRGWGGGGVCGLNRVYLEAGTRVFCYLIKNKERQLPNKPYVGFWVGKAGNLNNLNIGVDPGEGVGPGI